MLDAFDSGLKVQIKRVFVSHVSTFRMTILGTYLQNSEKCSSLQSILETRSKSQTTTKLLEGGELLYAGYRYQQEQGEMVPPGPKEKDKSRHYQYRSFQLSGIVGYQLFIWILIGC